MGSDVVGALFTDRNAASIAIDELHYAGFGDKQVGLVVRDGSDWKISGMGQNTDAGDAPTLTSNRAGASSGDTSSAGDAAGVPPVIIAPAPQASTGVAGSGAGGIGAGMFAAYGFDEALSGRLSGDLEKGAMLVVVKATGRSTEAKNILERNGGKMAR
jgi:hypothetical protein